MPVHTQRGEPPTPPASDATELQGTRTHSSRHARQLMAGVALWFARAGGLTAGGCLVLAGEEQAAPGVGEEGRCVAACAARGSEIHERYFQASLRRRTDAPSRTATAMVRGQDHLASAATCESCCYALVSASTHVQLTFSRLC